MLGFKNKSIWSVCPARTRWQHAFAFGDVLSFISCGFGVFPTKVVFAPGSLGYYKNSVTAICVVRGHRVPIDGIDLPLARALSVNAVSSFDTRGQIFLKLTLKYCPNLLSAGQLYEIFKSG